MSKYKYFPLIKTRDAELRSFKNLSKEVLEQILPIYELTKSRVTKKAPDGDIHRRMTQIKEIQDGRPFILDLSTDPRYTNPQIEQLVDPYNGFIDWQYFLNLYKDLNIIPMVHIYEDEDNESAFEDVEKFVEEVSKYKDYLAVRVPYDLDQEDYHFYLSPIVNNLNNDCSLIVLLDANYVRHEAKSNVAKIISVFVSSARAVKKLDKVEDIVTICTSFPSNPAQEGGEDAEGEFRIYEEQIYQGVKEHIDVKYGDYASINTEQIEMKGGTFVPRIDISEADGFIYKRYRRDDGSYPRCAKRMKADPRYKNISTWADNEIQLASDDKPTGISPSFWISVRIVYYINSRLKLRALD